MRDEMNPSARHWQRLRAALYLVGALLAYWNLRDFQWHPLDVSLFAIFLLLVWTETCPLCGAWLRTPNIVRLAFGPETCPACASNRSPRQGVAEIDDR